MASSSTRAVVPEITSDTTTIITSKDQETRQKRINELKATILPTEQSLNQGPFKAKERVHWDRTIEDRQLQEFQAWKKISTTCMRRSYTEDLRTLRSSNINRGAWQKFGYGFKNGSEHFHTYLQRTAYLEVNNLVRKWRERYCEKTCCASIGTERKWAKKYPNDNDKIQSLLFSLSRMDHSYNLWLIGIHRDDHAKKAFEAAKEELAYARQKINLEQLWGDSLQYVKQELEEKLEPHSLCLEDYETMEIALAEAEKEEVAKIEEQKRSQAENTCAYTYTNVDSDSDDDSDDEDDFFFSNDLPSAGVTISRQDLPSLKKNAISDRPQTLDQLDNELLTPPVTPKLEDLSAPSYTDEQALQKLSKALIIDLTAQQNDWTYSKADTFDPNYLAWNWGPGPHAIRCCWKLYPVPKNKVLYPALEQPIPELVLTSPDGTNFFLEERLPFLGREWEKNVQQRHEWSIMLNEAIRRGTDFEKCLQTTAVDQLYEEGWIPDNDDCASEFDASEFDQEIADLEQGQEFDTTSANTDYAEEQQEEEEDDWNKPTTVKAVLRNLADYNNYFACWSAKHFKLDSKLAWHPPLVLPRMSNICTWRAIPLPSTTVSHAPFFASAPPNIRLYDPEGQLYALEEELEFLDLDDDFVQRVMKRHLSQKDREQNLMMRMGSEEYGRLIWHFDQWEEQGEDEEQDQSEQRQEEEKPRPDATTLRYAKAQHDKILRQCLFEVKRDFINEKLATYRQQNDNDSTDDEGNGKKESKEERYRRKLRETCKSLRRKMREDNCLRWRVCGDPRVMYLCNVGQESLYGVEIKGPLAPFWLAIGKGKEERSVEVHPKVFERWKGKRRA